jgi:hypothetical protein
MVEENNNGGDISRYDELTVYCRALGHHVPFSYCREPGNRLFCSRIAACWGEKIDVPSFLETHFSADEIRQALSPPRPKMSSLVDLIRQARERTSK